MGMPVYWTRAFRPTRPIQAKLKETATRPNLHSSVLTPRIVFTPDLRRIWRLRTPKPNPRSPAQTPSPPLASQLAHQRHTSGSDWPLQEEGYGGERPDGHAHRRHPRRHHLAPAVQVHMLLQVHLQALARPHLPPPPPKEDAAIRRRLLLRRSLDILDACNGLLLLPLLEGC
ncbi:uncharacterized protein [Triticum aestivum]|uniref:uncharacterized protein n=1 Tax=Triticum aestivum TaxID=4565 RepID=UPI001D00C4C0|nr:uncharacterized protein LOC123057159 [Triticum aestivum]